MLIVYSGWLEEDGFYYVVRFRRRDAFNFIYDRNACGIAINKKVTGDKENLEKIPVKWSK
ncbi:MAG: hypothetical protein ABGW69_03155 [Nanoarchaeota archaeon]